ncbi:MAG: flavodoxin family protein [Clostridia bacterium]|nr:flavodoxin family protein [Clostridia bacterium]
MKKVVIISSSPQKDGNSEILAQKFAEGAIAAANMVHIFYVRDIGLKFCTGCLYCQSHEKCILNDGMNELYDTIQQADAVVLATPVYYYSVCGQLKTFLDRLNPLYPRANNFKDFYLLATSAEDDEHTMDGTITAVQGFIDCFEGCTLKGVIKGAGVTEKGDINKTKFPSLAYEAGENV